MGERPKTPLVQPPSIGVAAPSEAFQRQFSAMQGTLAAEKKVKQATLELADENIDRIRERNANRAKELGLTREQYSDVMSLKEFGSKIITVIEQGHAKTPDEAKRYLYQQAGDKAGAYADWLRRISDQKVYDPRQPETPWEQLNREMARHEKPPGRRKGKTRASVQGTYDRWAKKQEQEGPPPVTAQDDLKHEELIAAWQQNKGSAKNKSNGKISEAQKSQ